jgi:hypothetical protein
VELGSVAELLSAFGTLAALGAAGIAARAAIRTNNQQAEQLRQLEAGDRRREVEQEQRDAAVVAFWTAWNPEGPGVWYSNSSQLPVFDLRIRVLIPGRSFVITYLSLAPTTRHRPLNRVRRMLLAHEAATEPIDWERLLGEGTFRCAAMFRDSSGRWWTRGPTGLLYRQPDRETALREVEAAV